MSTALSQELRRGGIGGTDAGAILGLSPWKTPLDVWLDKMGMSKPTEMNEFMRWGVLLEPVVAARYSEVTGNRLWNPEKVYHHAVHDCLLGSPDRLVFDKRIGLEVKTAGAYSRDQWGEDGTDHVPAHYLVQCLHYMAVLDYDEWHLAALIGGNDFRIYRIRRDREFEAQMVNRLAAWWAKHVVGSLQPAIPGGQSASAWLQERFPREQMPELLPADTEAAALMAKLSVIKRDITVFEAQADEIENNLKATIGEAAGIESDLYRVTWKAPKPSVKTDWKGVASAALALVGKDEAKQLMEQNTQTSEPTRRFVLKEKTHVGS